ncbi:alpha/beta hydrolase [Calidifontibacter sp. DB0510]|uniref:Alpha/beta hydrolase n=1 Tax=Metallococcus carri TaxID=1656884 RepID=A0A967EHW6_9MICO|nr:alpha/beta hydrolase [Metallococcus carri]NHN57273.1 alpha/beta hydrolase [Metallococcus carri]NOP38122.1 alpha/beta hydrolase [Calidifontibacter sp. DB2511S]
MQADSLTLNAADGTPLHVYRWLPDGEPVAVVQIAHGMAEHAGRYARFAQALTDAGYAVYAEDHRGHGRTAAPDEVGYFADRDGFDLVVGDLGTVDAKARQEHPGLPVFLFGHSMGSFLSRAYLQRPHQPLAGVVLSGTGGDPGLLGRVGGVIAIVQGKVRGRRHRSGLMNTLTFGQYNAGFKPNRTDFDWLSRDPAEVDKYIADPDAGQVFTAGFYSDLLGGLADIHRDGKVARTPQDLPILLMSGDQDPVGANGKGVGQVAEQLRRAGVREVSVTLYPGGRHEMLNETNRDEVTADVIAWLDAHR